MKILEVFVEPKGMFIQISNKYYQMFYKKIIAIYISWTVKDYSYLANMECQSFDFYRLEMLIVMLAWFAYVSLAACEVEHLFMCFLAFFISCSVNCLCTNFAHFSFLIFVFFLWCVEVFVLWELHVLLYVLTPFFYNPDLFVYFWS